MKFVLEINNLDNAAFEGDNREHEVARILREVAFKVKAFPGNCLPGNCRDENGNTVGFYGYSAV